MSSDSPLDPIEPFQTSADKWADTIGRRLLRVLCPIYSESVHRPEPVGTAILVRVDDLVFLTTAAHVIEDVGRGARYFGAAEQLIPLPAFTIRNPLPPNGTRDQDRIDLGSWVLDPATASILSSADTLRLSDLDWMEPEQVSRDARYFLNGYPESRQPRKLLNDEFEARPFSFITEEMSDEEYGAAGRRREEHLLVAFEKEGVFYRGKQKTGPDLQGVSGGAIWRLSGSPGVDTARPVLSAIVIRWRQRDPKCVVGTRASVWARHTAAEFPEQFRREAARGAG